MNRYGIEVSLKNSPELDPGFFPLQRFNEAFLAEARKPIGIAVERAGGQMASVSTFIHGTPEMADADRAASRPLTPISCQKSLSIPLK